MVCQLQKAALSVPKLLLTALYLRESHTGTSDLQERCGDSSGRPTGLPGSWHPILFPGSNPVSAGLWRGSRHPVTVQCGVTPTVFKHSHSLRRRLSLRAFQILYLLWQLIQHRMRSGKQRHSWYAQDGQWRRTGGGGFFMSGLDPGGPIRGAVGSFKNVCL